VFACNYVDFDGRDAVKLLVCLIIFASFLSFLVCPVIGFIIAWQIFIDHFGTAESGFDMHPRASDLHDFVVTDPFRGIIGQL
jgi:hypothetical protein